MLQSRENATLKTLEGYDLFVFGDSLSDIGTLFTLTGGLIPPSPPYFEGRFSNGPIAAEVLADQLGVGHSQATNFAVGGARTGPGNNQDTDAVQFGGLLTQIERFSAQADALGADAEDLYLIWAGGNDFLALASDPSADPTSVVAEAVSNIVTAVTSLASSGAQDIAVTLLPNSGRIPLSLQANLLEPLTALTVAFNGALSNALGALESSIEGVNIILTDLFPIAEAIAQSPGDFGFENVAEPYLSGLIPSDPTADPDTFFFWDPIHPTSPAHAIFAEVFYESFVTGISDDIKLIGTTDADRLVTFSGDDTLRGRQGDDVLIGNLGNDHLYGNVGLDSLRGGEGNDLLDGGLNGDRLIGGSGNDLLMGQRGPDVLIGVNPNSENLGKREIDVMVGGKQADTFVLGDEARSFYDDGNPNRPGLRDFALITDLQRRDTIQLHGEASRYTLAEAPAFLGSGTAIFLDTEGDRELIGVVSGDIALSLDSPTISFV